MQAMPTRNISLTERLDAFVERSVASGDYQNASEMVRDALRLLEERKQEHARRLERLREAATEGFAAIDRGDYVELGLDEIGDYIASLREQVTVRPRKRKRAG
jgi:antitoxin ParD1/3/4